MLHIHKDGERGRGSQKGRGERGEGREGGREGGREEEGIITLQVHSDSRQDLHFNTHTITVPAKDSYKNYLRKQKIKLIVCEGILFLKSRNNSSSISNKLVPKFFSYYLQKLTCQNQFI